MADDDTDLLEEDQAPADQAPAEETADEREARIQLEEAQRIRDLAAQARSGSIFQGGAQRPVFQSAAAPQADQASQAAQPTQRPVFQPVKPPATGGNGTNDLDPFGPGGQFDVTQGAPPPPPPPSALQAAQQQAQTFALNQQAGAQARDAVNSPAGLLEYGSDLGHKLLGNFESLYGLPMMQGPDTDDLMINKAVDQMLPDGSPEDKEAFRRAFIAGNPNQRSQWLGALLPYATVDPNTGDLKSVDTAALSDALDRKADPVFQASKAQTLKNVQERVRSDLEGDPRLRGTTAGNIISQVAALPAYASAANPLIAPMGLPLIFGRIFSDQRQALADQHPDWNDNQLDQKAAEAAIINTAGAEAGGRIIGAGLGPLLRNLRGGYLQRALVQVPATAAAQAGVGAGTQALTNIAAGQPVGQGVVEAALGQGLVGALAGGVHAIPQVPMAPGAAPTFETVTQEAVPRPTEEAPPPTGGFETVTQEAVPRPAPEVTTGPSGARIRGPEEATLEATQQQEQPPPLIPARPVTAAEVTGPEVSDVSVPWYAPKPIITRAQERTAFTPEELARAAATLPENATPEQLRQAAENLRPEPDWTQQQVFLQEQPIPQVPVTQEDVARRTYEISQERQQSGQPGDQLGDWHQAQQELSRTTEPILPATVSEAEPINSAIANRYVQERMAAGELGQIDPSVGQSTEDMMQQGLQMSPNQRNGLIDNFMKGKGGDLDQQGAAIRSKEAMLSEQARAASRAADAEPSSPQLQAQAKAASDAVTAFHNGPLKKFKQVWSDSGRVLQREIPLDYTTLNGMKEAYLKANDKEAPLSAEPRLKQMADGVSKAADGERVALNNLSNEIEKATGGKTLPTDDQIRTRLMEIMKDLPCPT